MRKFQSQTFQRQVSCCYPILLLMNLCTTIYMSANAQSIGYHPHFNFGFNPYYSSVFGYGLGLPFGAYNISPTRYPWLLNSMPTITLADKTGLISKVHAKMHMTKLAANQILSPGYYGLKDKLNLMKHPEYAYTPFGAVYGYGKHYGAALVPNNPYKNTYSNYYDGGQPIIGESSVVKSIGHGPVPIGEKLTDSPGVVISTKPHSYYLKPLIKASAMLTTAAILGKILHMPAKLNPSGMIVSDLRP